MVYSVSGKSVSTFVSVPQMPGSTKSSSKKSHLQVDSLKSMNQIPPMPEFEVFLRDVFKNVVEALVFLHDILFIPVIKIFKTQEEQTRSRIAESLIKTCTIENVNSGKFFAEDLIKILSVLKPSFFRDLVRDLIKEVDGESSKAYREKAWETLTQAQFVQSYLVSNPYYFSTFLNTVLRSYL